MNIHSDPWTSLEAEGPGASDEEQGFLRRRMPLSSGMELFVALSFPGNMPALLVEIFRESLPARRETIACRGFRLDIMQNANARRNVLMALQLEDRRFRDVFAVLTEEIHLALDDASDERQGTERFLGLLRRWREFFKSIRDGVLSPEERQGLFGELWFLKENLLPRMDATHAVASWVGPNGAHQDFQTRKVAIEVKTTRSTPPQTFVVANILQLDETGLPMLLLQHLSIDPRPDGEQGLTGLVKDVRTLLRAHHPACLVDFDARLLRAGYRDADSDVYAESRFRIRHSGLYRVEPGFPRLREADLPTGIGQVRYSVELSACAGYELPVAMLDTLLSE